MQVEFVIEEGDSSFTRLARCPPEKSITGGGYALDSDVASIYASRPTQTEWIVNGSKPTGVTVDLDVWAICADYDY